MTNAVCIKCGAIKFGAFNPCHECGFQPSQDELMQSLQLTDHYHSLEELKRMGEAIAHGEDLMIGAASPVEEAVLKYNRAVQLAFENEREAALDIARKAHKVFVEHNSEHVKKSADLIARLEAGEPLASAVKIEVLEFVNAQTDEKAKELANRDGTKLFSEEAKQVFEALIEHYRSEPKAHRHLKSRRDLLKRNAPR